MNGTGKLISAFVAGLLLAVIGAVAYVKTHAAPPTPTPVVQQAAVLPPDEPKTLPDAGNSTPPSAPAPEPKPIAPAAPVFRHEVKHARKQEMIARNEPPSANPAANVDPAAAAASPYGNGPSTAPAMAPVAPAPAPVPTTPIAPPPPPPREPRSVTLASGTAIRIRLGQALNTDRTVEGDSFSGTLDGPIVIDNAVIAERGSRVAGRVVTSQKAGRVKGVAELAITLTNINTTDGQRITVQTNNVERSGSKSTGKDAAKVGGGAALGAIIGAIAGGGKGAGIGAGAGGAVGAGDVLLTRGKAAVMDTESLLTFSLATPVTITEHLNQ